MKFRFDLSSGFGNLKIIVENGGLIDAGRPSMSVL